MSPKKFRQRSFFNKIIGLILFISIVSLLPACKWIFGGNGGVPHVSADPLKEPSKGMDMEDSPWSSFNIVLQPGTTNVRAAILAAENAFIDQFNIVHPGLSNYDIHFRVFYCPCDSLLYNIRATLLDGSGESVVSPSPPPPPPGGSGDLLYSSINNSISEVDSVRVVDTSLKMIINKTGLPSLYSPMTLAIIDTGIDSTLFDPEISNILWRQESGTALFNFINGSDNYWDDHAGKHGSTVAAVALQAIAQNQTDRATMIDGVLSASRGKIIYPKLMILKALDRDKKGTTFTVSCALSYARQNNAALINASLGYYETSGAVDSVFRHYIKLCDQSPTAIPVFAAAGNTTGSHDPSRLCQTPSVGNEIKSGRLFYPACFSGNMTHVLTVSGMNSAERSCMYQNYSPTFVSFGVKKAGECCMFSVPFTSCEGSSFSTPAASGTAMTFLLHDENVDAFRRVLKTAAGSTSIFKEGKYMNY